MKSEYAEDFGIKTGTTSRNDLISSHAVLGEKADMSKCLICANLSSENICRVLRQKKSNCDWFELATLDEPE